jgi:hypothetical protein
MLNYNMRFLRLETYDGDNKNFMSLALGQT